jgi:hypothetical protein
VVDRVVLLALLVDKAALVACAVRAVKVVKAAGFVVQAVKVVAKAAVSVVHQPKVTHRRKIQLNLGSVEI